MTENLKTQPIKNISLMQEAVEGMIRRNKILPGMAVVYAPSGYGKSVAGEYIAKKYNAIYLQAGDSWSKKKLLNQILEQLTLPIKAETLSAKTDRIIESLKYESRPIIIDEFDYCITKKMLGIIREIHDFSRAPIILIGEELMPFKLKEVERFDNRILNFIPLEKLDLSDAKLLSKGLTTVEISEDLLSKVVDGSKGVARRIVVNIFNISDYAKQKGLKKIGVEEYKRPLFIGQPPKRG